jgi:hypothetical protein
MSVLETTSGDPTAHTQSRFREEPDASKQPFLTNSGNPLY